MHVQYPDAAPLIRRMVGTWAAQDDDRTFTIKFQKNLTIVLTAIEEECTYTNFMAPEYSVDELKVTFHCATKSWAGSGTSLYKFFRVGSTLLMIESSLVIGRQMLRILQRARMGICIELILIRCHR